MKAVIIVSLLVHLASLLLTLMGVAPVPTFFYELAWWSYIVAISALNSLRAGNSFLFDRPREFVWLFFLSTGVWLFFEAYNFRLHNWSYIGVPVEPYLRWPGYFIAYGTVLPALFETETLLRNAGFARRLRGPSLAVSGGLHVRLVLVGLLMMVAPLLNPQIFFPLVWLGLIFLLDPLLYRWRQEDSLLARLEQGDYARLVRLLGAGLVCGLLWEFWNFWAGAKWIYHIPYLGFLKIFEMPILGFLGFPPFALECYLLYRVFVLFRNRHLEGHLLRTVLFFWGFALYCWVIIQGIEKLTIETYKVTFL